MKIKLAILDKDQCYLNRIVTAFSSKYADKFELYSFTNKEMAMSILDASRIDVLVASDAFEIDVTLLPKRCAFAYFVDSIDIDTVNEQRAICRFQKADFIYKQILSIYSENAGSVSGIKLGDDSTKLIVFSSPCGGVGNSTVASACAMYFARKKKKTLYLNLEVFGSADSFFNAEGMFDMSDIIYALKSKKTNLSIKLESCVKQDRSGVYFYSQAKVALDMHELTNEDVMRLISEVKLHAEYDYIIVDMEYSMSKDAVNIYEQAHAVVWIGDGSDISNRKIERAYNALLINEQNNDSSLTNRLCLIYNRFSSKTGNMIGEIGLKNIGGVPVYLHSTTSQIINQISGMDMFENIV